MSTKFQHATLNRDTPVRKNKQATQKNPLQHVSVEAFLLGHGQASITSIGHLWRDRIANVLTILVIAFALALPASLLVILQNAQWVSNNWNNGAQISLFLKQSVAVSDVQQIVQKLQQQKEFQKVNFIPAEQGLQELQKDLGLSEALQDLPDNPIPGVIELDLAQAQLDEKHIQQMVNQLKTLPIVESVQLDLTWLKRLQTILQLAERAAWALAILLAFAVLLVIGNTIRLVIQNQREEIAIIKLIGGTNSFIRRPFLYMGIYYGLFAGIVALVIVNSLIWYLQTPAKALSELYGSHFQLMSLSFLHALCLIVVSMVLGWLGAWLAVGRQLKKIEIV